MFEYDRLALASALTFNQRYKCQYRQHLAAEQLANLNASPPDTLARLALLCPLFSVAVTTDTSFDFCKMATPTAAHMSRYPMIFTLEIHANHRLQTDTLHANLACLQVSLFNFNCLVINSRM